MRDSIERIRRVLDEGTIKKGKLAEEAGFSADVLIGAENPDWNPRAKTVEALIDALDRIAARLAA
jgi:predicted transcriptional regulator